MNNERNGYLMHRGVLARCGASFACLTLAEALDMMEASRRRKR